MIDLKIKNLTNEEVEVRIIPLTSESQFVNYNDEFYPLDEVEFEHGVKLMGRPEVNCADGTSHAGVIEMDLSKDTPIFMKVTINDEEFTVTSFKDLEIIFKQNGLSFHDLSGPSLEPLPGVIIPEEMY